MSLTNLNQLNLFSTNQGYKWKQGTAIVAENQRKQCATIEIRKRYETVWKKKINLVKKDNLINHIYFIFIS